jgi:hypothetical protein
MGNVIELLLVDEDTWMHPFPGGMCRNWIGPRLLGVGSVARFRECGSICMEAQKERKKQGCRETNQMAY